MKLLIKYLFFSLLFVFALSAQQKDYSSEPGYIDFGDLESLEKGSRVIDVLLEGNLLKLVGKFTESDDPELADLITGLKLIKAKVLQVTRDNEKELTERFNSVEKQLKDKNWSMLVRIRDEGENVNVYLKSNNMESIEGLTVAVLDYKEATFVNIIGEINLETIGKLSRKFDIPALDRINGR